MKEENLAIDTKSSLHGSNMCTVDITVNYVWIYILFSLIQKQLYNYAIQKSLKCDKPKDGTCDLGNPE